MKRWQKNLLIILSVFTVLLLAGGWFYLWSTSFSGDIAWRSDAVPAPAKILPPLTEGPGGWPSWLGPTSNNESPVTGIRKDWSRGLKKIWQAGYLCSGPKSMAWSSPAIQGNRLVVPGRDGTNDHIFCLDPATGILLWVKSYTLKSKMNYGQGHRATPAIDGDAVFTFSREGDVRCHALFDGELRWEYNIKRSGCVLPEWGSSGSPLVYKDVVIVHGGGKAIALALDKRSGAVRWMAAAGTGCYSSPVIMPIRRKDYVVLYHKAAVSFIDAATGRTVWDIPTGKYETEMTVVTPAVHGDMVLVSTMKGGGSIGIRIENGVPVKVWENDVLQSYQSNPVIRGGIAYCYSGMPLDNSMGSFVCMDIASGKKLWSTNVMGFGTSIFADGHIINLDLSGTLYLVKPDTNACIIVTKFPRAVPEGKKRVWTKPVIAGDNIYIRHGNILICYRLR